MSDQEKFLARWSRRKLKPANEKVPVEPPQDAAAVPPASEDAAKPAVAAPARQGEATPAPEFDLSKLPSLDSIGADSDIRAFLQAGVPSALKHAALRRAWSADPAIRDYIGPNENFWEGAGPDGVPGFGDLDPSVDVKKLVAEIFRDAEPIAESRADVTSSAVASEQPRAKTDIPATESVAHELQQSAPQKTASLLQRDENIAPQQDELPDKEAATNARRHGGAMPS